MGWLVLAVNGFLAHQLAPAAYGRYALVFWMSLVCGAAGSAGIYTAAPRFISEALARGGDAAVAGRIRAMMSGSSPPPARSPASSASACSGRCWRAATG